MQNRVIRRLHGYGAGCAFSAKDFADLGARAAIDVTLHRLVAEGKIRRIMRGIYEYPRQGQLLGGPLSPDLDQAAQALARKFGWRIQPTGPVALNAMGLSTQVPSRFVYLSDGPNRSYPIGSSTIEFKHTAMKEIGFKHPESTMIVHGLKSLGQDGVSPPVIEGIRRWLKPNKRAKVLKDTRSATDWVYQAIRKICREDDHG